MTAKLNAKLDPEAKIYNELRQQPEWWKRLISMKGVYVDIRKDNTINIYFEGGNVAKLTYTHKALKATCHYKYLGLNMSPKEKDSYIDCLDTLMNNPASIIENIKKEYSQKGAKNEEDVSEKKMQGDLICHDNIYLDSEFAHRFEEGKNKTIRFDLVAIKENQLSFIELKRIQDNRLLNKYDDKPEILIQMDQYSQFIKAYKDALLTYYKQLYTIKQSLGLPVPPCNLNELSVCEIPHLIIKNTYTPCKRINDENRRKERIERITTILNGASSFTFSIIK